MYGPRRGRREEGRERTWPAGRPHRIGRREEPPRREEVAPPPEAAAEAAAEEDGNIESRRLPC